MPTTRRPKIDVPFTSDEEIAELVERFEACTWPYERWTHRSHLAVAVSYLRRLPLEVATDRARQHIQLYNRTCGDPDGYHETITVLFMRRVAQHLRVCNASRPMHALVNELCAACDTTWPLQHYSHDRLWSPEARRTWVEPDLKPLTC